MSNTPIDKMKITPLKAVQLLLKSHTFYTTLLHFLQKCLVVSFPSPSLTRRLTALPCTRTLSAPLFVRILLLILLQILVVAVAAAFLSVSTPLTERMPPCVAFTALALSVALSLASVHAPASFASTAAPLLPATSSSESLL
jgi:hypothetical protein